MSETISAKERYDGILEVSIKHIVGRKRCPVCKQAPEVAYWGDGEMMVQCPRCRGKIYVSRIGNDERQITPAILRALDSWNEFLPGRNVKRPYEWIDGLLRRVDR